MLTFEAKVGYPFRSLCIKNPINPIIATAKIPKITPSATTPDVPTDEDWADCDVLVGL